MKPLTLSLLSAAILLTLNGGLVSTHAWAQSRDGFQLPRECSERQVSDPSKCVIQDGAPHRVYPATRNANLSNGGRPYGNPAPSATAVSNSTSSGAGIAPRVTR